MYAELYKPDPAHPATIAALKSARLETPFPVQLCDVRHPHRRCIPAVCKLKKLEGEYWFLFVAQHPKRGEFSYRQHRELVLQWVEERANTPPLQGSAGDSGFSRPDKK
jgi:hypothetical protein